MKNIITLMLIAVAANVAIAQKQKVSKAEVSFKIRNMGFNVKGTIGGLQADINFDKAKPTASSIVASVDVSTINTDNEKRDKHLKTEDYFDVAKYPRITMRSTAIKHVSANNYAGVFNVTIKGKTISLNVPFTYVSSGSSSIFQAEFKVKRSEFSIGKKILVLGDDVTVNIEVTTTP